MAGEARRGEGTIRTAICATLIFAVLAGSATAGLTPQRQQVAAQLNRGLVGTRMAGTGRQMESAGFRYRLHPAFIAAVASLESSWGWASCSRNPWNMWGLGACDRRWKVPHLSTPAVAYGYFARFIRERWPSADSPYDIGPSYCPDCPTGRWGWKVQQAMSKLGFAAGLRYGA